MVRSVSAALAALCCLALVSPLAAQCELSPLSSQSPAAFAEFGAAVALDGDTAVVGSPGYFSGQGKVSIYVKNALGWELETELLGPDSVIGDRFGAAVDVERYDDNFAGYEDVRRVAIAAPGRDLPGLRQGAVYLFESRPSVNDGAWTFLDSIEDPGSTTTVGEFGAAVAVSQFYLFVGAPGDDASGSLAGAVRAFAVDPNTGELSPSVVLTDPSPYSYQRFGAVLAGTKNRLAVGAPDDHEFSSGAGSVHVYWHGYGLPPTYMSELEPELIAGLGFGSALGVKRYGDLTTVMIGAPMLDGSAPGRVFTATLYLTSSGTAMYDEPVELVSSAPEVGDRFGASLSFTGFQGDILAVGAPGAGVIRSYERLAEFDWELRYEHTDTGAPGFGEHVAVDEEFVLAGVPGEDAQTGTVRAFGYDGALCPELCDAPLVPLAHAATAGGGATVARTREYALVGAPQAGGGAVSVLRRNGSCWSAAALPTHPTLDAGDSFGAALAFDSTAMFAIVGAPTDDAVGIASAAPGPGSARVYRRTLNGWIAEADLTAFALPADAGYGRAVALGSASGWSLDKRFALVGYRDWDGSGAVRAWREVSQGGWVQGPLLKSPTPSPNDGFGDAVAAVAGLVAVAAPGEGKVHLYDETVGDYVHVRSFDAPAGAAGFGERIALSSKHLVVAAPAAGRVFLWTRTGSTFDDWFSFGDVVPSASAISAGLANGFGASVALGESSHGSRIYAGAPGSNAVLEFEIAGSVPVVRVHTAPSAKGAASFGANLAGGNSDLGADVLVGAPGTGDAFYFEAWAEPESLCADSHAISLASGGEHLLQLDAGPEHAGEIYWMLGSLSGLGPTPFFGVDLPLTVDLYFNMLLGNPAAAPVKPSIGVLDAAGRAQAGVVLPPGMNPDFAGVWAHHAFFTLGDGVAAFASDAESLKLVP